MSQVQEQFSPGTLVSVRGRDWVVQPESGANVLHLRPFGGTDEDIIALIPALEPELPTAAVFPRPAPASAGTHDAARLLHDALKLKLRNGAGPFRSFGNIAVEPRAYQLAPLMMALRLPVIRLLVADDVGVGKTIEAGLIARELLDRGEISRLAVLCPPHLVEQWQQELSERFQIQAVALTAGSVGRLERQLPLGMTLFDQYPFVVVSLDYIKSERHREHFLSIAPELIIVDEAHTCVSSGKGKQLRFELLKRLVNDDEPNGRSRHLLLLTATPHSGDESAFYSLLSLLNPKFAELQGMGTKSKSPLRDELALHFIQRRRKDIEEWQDTRVFPRRETTEITYKLTGRWGTLFDTVQDYCLEFARRMEQEREGRVHLIWYVTLSLLRCVASSPAAAEKALMNRLQGTPEEIRQQADEERVLDGSYDDLDLTDLEPAAQLEDETYLSLLIEEAQKLAGSKGDPKLKALITHIQLLLDEGFRPVIFCRYIATAHYVAEQLKKHFKKATIDSVTGDYTPDEREERVAALAQFEQPILVATDCLSEGINLQHIFNAVVHYDLAWNPTRHEQREGRVDRFGQKSPVVRSTMLYGEDNPVDGFVLNVILRKAEAIRKELGVLVPMPDDERSINQALVKAALMKRSKSVTQPELNLVFADDPLESLDVEWQDAMEKAKTNQTIFAQRRLRPVDVLPEWNKQQQLLGNEEAVADFVRSALQRLGSPLAQSGAQAFRLLPEHLPLALKERLKDEDIEKSMAVDFYYPPVSGAQYIHRSHPLVTLLADYLLETALGRDEGPSRIAARCAATITTQVEKVTTLYLLRLRHQLSVSHKGIKRELMAEETVAMALQGRTQPEWLSESETHTLLNATPSGNLSFEASQREIQQAIDYLEAHDDLLNEIGRKRAKDLLNDHTRVRKAAQATFKVDEVGQTTVTACLPVDVMGIYVLLPDEL